MMYRGSWSADTNHDTVHWQDGPFRRGSFQAVLNVFAGWSEPDGPAITSFSPTSGTAGVTSVVITGSGFTGATAARFNGVASSYSVDSDLQVTATCPTGATTGKIQVTTPNGTGTSALDFTVGATPPPDLPLPAANHLRIGIDQIGTVIQNIGNDLKRVLKRPTGQGASGQISIDKAYAWLSGPPSGGNQAHSVVVYDDDAVGGLPGSLRGVSDQTTVLQGAAGAWVAFNFSTPALVTGDQVYFGLIENGPGTGQVGTTPVSGAGWLNSNLYSAGASNPFGNPTVINLEPSLVVDYTITSDTRAPVFVSASAQGQSLILIYDETLDQNNMPASTAFAVTVNQTSVPLLPTTGMSGSTFQLFFSNPIVFVDILTVAYTQPALDPLQDAFGNLCVSFSPQSVLNQTQPVGGRSVNPSKRVAIARRVDPTDRRAGEGGGL